MNWSSLRSSIQPAFILMLLISISCKEKRQESDEELRARAVELAHRHPIIDGHVDLPSVLLEKKFVPGKHRDTLMHTGNGQFDYVRAVAGGLYAPFMSIYISASDQKMEDYGKARADSLIDIVRGIASTMPAHFALANTPVEIDSNFRRNKISLPLGMENGAPIGKDLKNLRYFFERGIRYITLTHSRDNQICDSSGDTLHTWNGLSPFGREVVREMNRIGIMVDISHVDDTTFYQVMDLTSVPCIASHSSCRIFAPTVRRDMTDDMILRMGENKGVILVNFYTVFLDSAAAKRSDQNKREIRRILAARNLRATDPEGKKVSQQFEKEHPYPPVNVSVVADHIDHIVKLIGIDHVGLGSDFDGAEGHLPVGLSDVSMYPNLIYILLKRGYSEEDIVKITGGNFRRVWEQVLAAAQKQS